MTVMPDHSARLPETAHVLVLDSVVGPVDRPISGLALGDEILVVADGRMCFRRVMASGEATPPDSAVSVPTGAIGNAVPRRALLLDSRQKVGIPVVTAKLEAASEQPGASAQPATGYWIDLVVEGADCIITENVAIGTGSLPEPTPQVTKPAPPASVDPPLRAFNGAVEIPLVGVSSDGPTSVLRFLIPSRTTTLRLSSVSAQPPGDGRRLGVAVLRIQVESNDIPLDSPALIRGFHRAEAGEGLTWRWTDGDALIILPPRPAPQTLAVHIADWHLMLTNAN